MSILEKYITEIEKTDIYSQFELFNLICLTYNKKDIGFRYCEFPSLIRPYIDQDILYSPECKSIHDFRKMDKGRKSIYFYKFSDDVKPYLRKIHDCLVPKFPMIKEFLDDDETLFIEKRIIDPKYINEADNE